MGVLTNQIAILTGASGGIGQAIAMELAAEGVHLLLIGRDVAKLEIIAEQVRMRGVRAISAQIDLYDDQVIKTLALHVQQSFGVADILIHCAGLIALGAWGTTSVADLDKQYAINIRAPVLITQELLPILSMRKGQIVFLNSSVGLTTARAGVGQYAATKHALKVFADSLREEVNQEGVRVLSVYPGRTASPMQVLIHEAEKKTYYPERLMQPADIATILISALKIPRSAEVTDIVIRAMLGPIHSS